MTEWKQYRRKELSEMMPYREGMDMLKGGVYAKKSYRKMKGE
jgi:hypothetical protein